METVLCTLQAQHSTFVLELERKSEQEMKFYKPLDQCHANLSESVIENTKQTLLSMKILNHFYNF